MRDRIRWMLTVLMAALTLTPVLAVSQAPAGVTSYTVAVDGMACPFCTFGVEQHLGSIPGVEAVDTRLADGEVDVRTTGTTAVTPEAIEQAVDEAGFQVSRLDIAGEALIDDGVGEERRVSFGPDLTFTVLDFDGPPGRYRLRATLLGQGSQRMIEVASAEAVAPEEL